MISVSGWAIALRLLVAVLLGAILGLERELKDKSAGIRTHSLISLGACLFTLISIDGFGGRADPSRVAAQIVTGIGFLGAGAILSNGASVRGLTTAAGIWVTAAVGTACGLGYLAPAAGSVAGAIAVLIVLGGVRKMVRGRAIDRDEIVVTVSPGVPLGGVMAAFGAASVRVDHLDIRGDDGEGQVISAIVHAEGANQVHNLVASLNAVPGVSRVEWGE